MAKEKRTIVIKKEDCLFDPRACTYKLCGEIRDHVDKLIDADSTDEDTQQILVQIMEEEETNKNTLSYDSLVKLHKYIQRADRDYLDLFHIFLSQCKCIKPKPRDNKQLEERLRLLRLKDSQSIYNNLAINVDKSIEDKIEKIIDGKDGDDLTTSKVYSNLNNCNNNKPQSSEFKRLHGSLVAIFNSFLVFICTFIFCYKALEYSLPEPNIVAQTLFGIGGSTIVAIAELYFLIRVL